MTFGKLYWLSLLSVIGLLRFVLDQPLLSAFFGFLGFLEFREADERDQANLAKAGLATFVATILGITGLFFFAAVLRYSGTPVTQMGRQMMIGLIGLYLLVVFTFHISKEYYDRRGE